MLPEIGRSGLQISRAGVWIDVAAPEGYFVVNIGDFMEHWTSGRWVSTLHRAVARLDQPSRKSIAFFHPPDWEAKITPISEKTEKALCWDLILWLNLKVATLQV